MAAVREHEERQRAIDAALAFLRKGATENLVAFVTHDRGDVTLTQDALLAIFRSVFSAPVQLIGTYPHMLVGVLVGDKGRNQRPIRQLADRVRPAFHVVANHILASREVKPSQVTAFLTRDEGELCVLESTWLLDVSLAKQERAAGSWSFDAQRIPGFDGVRQILREASLAGRILGA